MAFQSTRPVKGATRSAGQPHRPALVSIHAPREGRDANPIPNPTPSVSFQSTRPVKGATRPMLPACWHSQRFNPRAP